MSNGADFVQILDDAHLGVGQCLRNMHKCIRVILHGHLHPLAAAVAVDPSLVECFDLPMKVETETGDFHGTRGRTIGDPAGLIDPSAPRVHVALTVNHSRFVEDFTRRIAQLADN